MIEKPESLPVRPDLHRIPDLQAAQNARWKIDQRVIDPAVFASYDSLRTTCWTTRDAHAIPNTRESHEREVGAISRTDNFATVVVDRGSWFNVVARKSDAAITDALIDGDAARSGEYSRDAVVTHAINGCTTHWVRDLTGQCDHNEIAQVHPRCASGSLTVARFRVRGHGLHIRTLLRFFGWLASGTWGMQRRDVCALGAAHWLAAPGFASARVRLVP